MIVLTAVWTRRLGVARCKYSQ